MARLAVVLAGQSTGHAKARVCDPFVDHYLHVIKTEDRSQVYAMTSEEIPTD